MICDLNTPVKKAVDRLLPLLGDRIQLNSFLASDVVPADVFPAQIEEIVAELFAGAREQMQAGGDVFLRTENGALPSGEIAPQLTFEQAPSEVDDTQPEEAEIMLRAVRNIVEESHGFVSMHQTPYRKTLIRICLPVFQQFHRPSETVFYRNSAVSRLPEDCGCQKVRRHASSEDSISSEDLGNQSN
jgi:hypothetical protein